MWRYKRLTTLFILSVTVVAIQYSFYPAGLGKNLIQKYADNFLTQSKKLEKVAEGYKFDEIEISELRDQILRTRNSYKRIEFLLEYYYPEYVKSHINGAPLLQIEKHDTKPFVIPPEGLQVLDELIFSDDPGIEKLNISNLAQKLNYNSRLLVKTLDQQDIKTVDVERALRLQLVRIVSMGITGFDTPGSLNALEEAKQSLISIREFISLIKNEGTTELFEKIDKGIYMLENGTFENFDRLALIKEVINPLYADLKSNAKGSDKFVGAWNPNSSNIFSVDFLNPYFYTELTKGNNNQLKQKLGEKLFFEPLLSKDNKLSCASCHNPNIAFSDGLVKSESNIKSKTVLRNSPGLLNSVYADRYFYDLRAFTLEQQTQHVFFDEKEFNTSNKEVIEKLSKDESYKELFNKAFDDKRINSTNLKEALASYVLSLQSNNSKFDQFVRGEIEKIEKEIKEGFNLFMGKANCGTCHFAPTFSGLVPPLYVENESEILGVLKNPKSLTKILDEDEGRSANQVHNEKAWIYNKSFKTVTVRNVEITAPYFHNGAFLSIQEVLDFYNNGGGIGHGLEVPNQTLSGDSLFLSQKEMDALTAFMNALTDTSSYKNHSLP